MKIREAARQLTDLNEKYIQEQDKADKFFTKAEKYKLIAKDYRKDIDRLKQQVDTYKVEISNYDDFLRNKEMTEAETQKDKQYILSELLGSLR